MLMSRKRPRNDDVEAALEINEETSNGDGLLNGHCMNEDEAEFLNGASSSGVEYSPPVVSKKLF